jgi:hypothetical protein
MAANTTIFAALGVPDTDYAFLRTYGQEVIYDTTLQILGDHNGNLADVSKLFVERETKNHSEKYKLPGVGRLQRRGRQSDTAAVKATGDWTVNYPLEDFGASLQIDDVSFAYMTLQDYDLHLGTILRQDMNVHRFEMLRAMFNNTARTFMDELWGALTVQPLANGDATLYPPVVGAEVNAAQNNFLGVATSAIAFADSNDPVPTIVNQIEQNFGTPTGGSKIVIFCNQAQTPFFQALSNFDTVPNRFVEYGVNVSLVPEVRFPDGSPIIGRYLGETDSAIIMEWRFIPSGYLLGLHLDAPKPLVRRVDPPETGLGTGLQLIMEDVSSPIWRSAWRDRFGYGVGNRLNGVVMDLTAATPSTYVIPSQYV